MEETCDHISSSFSALEESDRSKLSSGAIIAIVTSIVIFTIIMTATVTVLVIYKTKLQKTTSKSNSDYGDSPEHIYEVPNIRHSDDFNTSRQQSQMQRYIDDPTRVVNSSSIECEMNDPLDFNYTQDYMGYDLPSQITGHDTGKRSALNAGEGNITEEGCRGAEQNIDCRTLEEPPFYLTMQGTEVVRDVDTESYQEPCSSSRVEADIVCDKDVADG